MKNIKRFLALLLTAALLAGLLPVAVLTAAATAPEEDSSELLAAAPRSSVMLDASGMKKADTVILGYAENGGKYYPLEWQVGNVERDSIGRTGGRLLISKYLLPAAATDSATGGIDTAASYGAVAMSDGSTTSIHMPESEAVLSTYKTDADYIANLGSNLSKYNLWYPADVTAGLSVRGENAVSGRRTLEDAAFFELSAEEAESCITNSVDELSESSASKLLRRPYAAGYAVAEAGDRSWALRGKSLLGDALAVSRGSSNSYYDNRAEGLVREAGESTLSRPAFNLRTNAVSFYYATSVKANPSADKHSATPKETPVEFGGSETLYAVTEKSGAITWRAALETLPMMSLTADYHTDGTVEIDFENDAKGYKIGVLTADSNGKLLSYGTARDDDRGGHALFKPGDGVSKMYFFAYKFNSNTAQLYTSNLIEVDAHRNTAMMLGMGLLQTGDKVYFNDNAATVLNAETAISGMGNTGSSGSLTQTNNSIDDPPVRNDEAMLMAIDTSGRVDYGTTAQMIADRVPFLSATRYYDDYAKALADAQAELNTAAAAGTSTAKASKEAIKTRQADYFHEAFGEVYNAASPLSKAIAYTWLSDNDYQLSDTYSEGYFPYTGTASVQAEKGSVAGKQLFFLSAGEFCALPISSRLALGNAMLRSKVTETYDIPSTTDSLTVVSDPAVAWETRAATLNSFFYTKSDIREMAAFHLRKDKIVYTAQKGALDRSVGESLHTVGSLTDGNTAWEAAILDDSLSLGIYSADLDANNRMQCSIGINTYPNVNNAYLALLVTDRSGAVKQYGRVRKVSSTGGNSVSFCTDDCEYGDCVYVVYEYETVNASTPTVYASEPLLLWKKTLDGTLRIEPAAYRPGETVHLDLSDVKHANGTTLGYAWYGEKIREYIRSTDLTCKTAVSDLAVDAYVSVNYDQRLTAHAKQTADFPVHPGEEDPDYFKGGTLYYGADSDDDTADYAWTVVGSPTEGIVSAKDASALPQYEDAGLDNAVELLRKTATPQGSTDTVLRGYMSTGVMLTDIRDEAISNRNLKADVYSAENQTVFQMSYADYTALSGDSAALFAAAEGSSWGRDYVLRNHSGNNYFTVDTLLNLQSSALGTAPCTKEGINVNNQTIVFYTPAACELTYETLLGCRQTQQGDWKATVVDPELFSDMQIEHVETSFNVLGVYGSFGAEMEDRYITAWGVKDGKIIWMDSKVCEGKNIQCSFSWNQSLTFDELYFVARKDNGLYRSDICSDLYSAFATEVQIRFYIDGEEAPYYEHYTLQDSQGKDRTTFEGGEQAYFRTESVDALYIQKVEVIFSDGTNITKDKLNRQIYDIDFTVKGVRPVVKVYIETKPRPVSVYVICSAETEPYTLTAPSSCLPDHSYDFTINVEPGFYISSIVSLVEGYELPNTHPITVVKDGEELEAYSPGTYTKQVDFAGDIIEIYIEELPFSLQVTADPLQGGTVTASLPDGKSMTTLAAGDSVTVSAQPNENYVLRGFTMKTQGGEETALTADGNTCTFKMPAENTIVTAHFAKKNTVTVKLFMDGKPTDTGASWTLTDSEGKERSIFIDGEQARISATADTGLAISYMEVTYSDGTGYREGSLSNAQILDFTVRDTDPVVGIYLTKAQVPIAIEAQTVDAEGKVLDEQGGSVYAPTSALYGDSFTYNASANEGYYISAISCNDAPVPNTDPEEYPAGGTTVIGYGAEEYRMDANADSIYILVQFTGLPSVYTVTSEFYDISYGVPAAVTASVTYTVNGEAATAFCAGDEVTATVSCAGNLAVAAAEATPETVLTQTDKYTFTFTMPAKDLAVTYKLKKLAVRSAYLHVNEDINLIYTVQIPEGFENPSAVFTLNGTDYPVNGYFINDDGRYCFEFTHITPQCMGDLIDITVSASMNGYTYSHTNQGYSVRKYCENTLKTSKDELLIKLLSDTLTYGAASQKYRNYKTDALVTDGLQLTPSTYPGLNGLEPVFVGKADTTTVWNGVGLRLSNTMCLDYSFRTDSTDGLSVEITVDGRTRSITEFTPVDGEKNTYRFTFRGIFASEFGATVSAKFVRDGEEVGNILKYSVNTYICGKQSDSDETLANLVKAVYNYGASALQYYNERILKQ